MRQAVTVHQAVHFDRLGKLSRCSLRQSSQEILQQSGFVV
jgi:hypothetical protein